MKTNKASVLVFSLIILFMALTIALGITGTTIISQKMAGSTGSSTQAFQTADSGMEIILKKIKDANDDDNLSSLGCTESGGKAIFKKTISSGEYTVIFYNDTGNPIPSCSAKITEVDRIRSIGSYNNTTRAVEMAVAAGGVPSGTLCGVSFYTTDENGQNPANLQSWSKCDGQDVLDGSYNSNCPIDYELTKISYAWADNSGTHTRYYTYSCAKK